MAQFEIFDQQNKFPWRLRANDATVITVSSRSYPSKVECQSFIAFTKALALEPTNRFFDVFRDQQGRFRWRLRLDTTRVLAISLDGFASRPECERAITQVRRLAPTASVMDQTEQAPANLPPVASFTATTEDTVASWDESSGCDA